MRLNFNYTYFNMLKFFVFLTILLFFNSCVITYTPGFYSGYSRLTDKEKSLIIFSQIKNDICSFQNEAKIIAITGTQLKDCISTQNKSLVYFWSPNCFSDRCYSINLIQDYCINNNLTFFIVAEYYDFAKMRQEIDKLEFFPLFSINEKYYKTQYCNKYNKLFKKDLLKNQNYQKNVLHSNIFVFENGKLLSTSLNF